jgi:two-component system sensor histidine kinase HydH
MEKSLDIFLSFARPARPERHDQDLAELARRTLDLVRGRAERQRVALELSGPAGPLVAPVDGEQIHQVLVNLCLNALDAMPAGGILQVSLGVAGPGLAEVRVVDSGPGIPGETLARLFEPFFSTKETGLGLGLVISRRIAEDHGGTLTAANSPEGGGCMTVRLPLSGVRGAEVAGRMGPNRPR